MDELIKKQDAIDALFEWYETPEDQDAVDVICNVPPAQQWIPVSERLPEDGTEVLASTENYVYMAELKTYDGKHLWEESEGRWILADVTAWMPLPPIYESEEKE